MFDYELLIPIVLFISMAVVIGLYFMFRHRTRAELQLTVRTALEKGQELTPEIIERLGEPRRPPHTDLRRALVWLAIGVGFVAFAVLLGEEDAVRPLIAIGAFPLAIGIAYLIMSRFGEKETST
jgi:hypothetical protein